MVFILPKMIAFAIINSFNLPDKKCIYLNHDGFVDPPSLINLTQKEVIEAHNLFIICGANPGNPNLTIFAWTKVDSGFKQNGSTLQLPNIQRNSSGTYQCTAENTYSSGAKGTNSQTMVVNVLCRVFSFSITVFFNIFFTNIRTFPLSLSVSS